MGATYSREEEPTEAEIDTFEELQGFYQENLKADDEVRLSDKQLLQEIKYGWAAGTSATEPTMPMGVEELEQQLAEEQRSREEAERIYKEHILGLKEKLIPALRRVKVVEEQLVAERSETQKVEQDLVREIKERKMAELAFKTRISGLESNLYKTQQELEEAKLRMESFEADVLQKAKVERDEAVAQQRRKWMAGLRVAELSLFEERKEKLTLQSWLRRFDTPGFDEPRLNHAEMAMSKFAQSVAYAPIVQPIDFKNMVASGVMQFLIRICHPLNKQKVLGPAALALSHLARDDASKREVAALGGVKSLLLLLQMIDREPVLCQVCRTLASVALIDSVKMQISAHGGIRILARLVSYVEDEDMNVFCKMQTEAAQAACLHALVNITFNSDSNRTALAAAGAIEHVVRLLQETASTEVLQRGCQLLANLAYNHRANQALIASAEGDDALARGCACVKSPACQVAALTGVANLVHSERNQAQVGSGPIPERLVQVLSESQNDEVLRAAAMAVGSMAYNSFLNKNRMVEQRVHLPLINLCSRPMTKALRVMVYRSIGTVALSEANQRAFGEEDGLSALISSISSGQDEEILEAAAMALVAQAPDLVSRLRLQKEGRQLPFLVAGGLDALRRVQSVVFGDASPPWLENAIESLSVSGADEYIEKARRFSELYPRWFLAKDLSEEVAKESDQAKPVTFRFSGDSDS